MRLEVPAWPSYGGVLTHQGAQTFGAGIHACGDACRAAADDHDVE